MWQEVRDPDHHKLLFRYDPLRNLVQVGSRGMIHVVDLNELRQSVQPPPQNRASESQE